MIPTTIILVGVPVFKMDNLLSHCLSVELCLAPFCSHVMFGRTELQGQGVTRTRQVGGNECSLGNTLC